MYVFTFLLTCNVLAVPDAYSGWKDCSWTARTGHHSVTMAMSPSSSYPWPHDCPQIAEVKLCTGMQVRAFFEVATCLRFRNPTAIVDGERRVSMQVIEEGTRGEPGWKWKATMPEWWYGPSITYEVDTYNVCEFVS